jgi:hypothetical protein
MSIQAFERVGWREPERRDDLLEGAARETLQQDTPVVALTDAEGRSVVIVGGAATDPTTA